MRFMTTLVAIILSLFTSTAEAKELKLKWAEAKSHHPEQEGVNYAPKNLKDNKVSTVWVEGESGSGLGTWVKVDLDGTQTVSKIKIWNGNWYTADFWQRHNRMKDIEVELSDGSKHEFTLTDKMEPEVIKLPKATATKYVKIRYTSIYKGSTFNDTCISEVQVHDASRDTRVLVSKYAASSVYPSDTDGNYEPKNVGDGMLDSMWCEGTDGDGTGEWISFDFGSPKPLARLKLRNGNTYSFSMNMKANRATKITLTYSDGSKTQHEIRPSMTEQTIALGGKTTSSVKMSFDEISKGQEYNDLCISEAVFEE